MHNIAKQIKDLVKKAGVELGLDLSVVNLEHPDNIDNGDYSTNVALAYAKVLGKAPRVIAEEIKDQILKIKNEEGIKEIEKIEVAGAGFINFYLSREFFVESVREICQNQDFGSTNYFKGKVWEIEHTSPNPNKAMHLGHLRNNVTGMAISNILEANGAKVIREEVDNNRGIAIAKLMWGYLKFARKDNKEIVDVNYWQKNKDEWQTPDYANSKPDKFVDALYVKGAEDFKNKDIELIVRDFVVKWENKDGVIWDLWNTVLQYAYEGQQRTLKRLGNKWDYVWHEHEHYQEGKDLVEEGLKKGVFKRLEDGAILTNLEKYGFSDTIVQKSDGTALYITQDIALTKLKKEKFKADFMAWVIGPEQSLAMNQLFAVCDALGIGNFSHFLHIPYGYMSIKGKGKMSSREGTVLYIDDILDEAKEVINEKIKKEYDNSEKEIISEAVALGAVKFSILKSGRLTNTAFDFDTSLELEGDSGPYLMYSFVRAYSILEKAKRTDAEQSTLPDTIFPIEKILYRFPEIVEKAGMDLAPNYIVTYLTELASAFSNFYAQGVIVSDAPDSQYKVAITKAFSVVMKRGLELLGIPVLTRM